ncbi:SurA N-terminal domain-containing protein [Acidocella aromatica]|uniref:Peptidyl-prolyl cis-trans isomerase D n=1 Tax=Acidocella aromatica TaxID=1303579 RepID=A0A840VKN7_9PROT|nr:SurA N-terminal domain-containing protein [Acidocella aromatica]MBB5372799.1 peptidyl-prolyl cis-trans isomerase D [Acidocella aromatica]
MLVWVRKIMSNWVARGFFGLLVVLFLLWGISNVFTLAGGSTAVARVAGKPVDISAVQAAYQALLTQAAQNGQPQPDAATRQQIAEQALAQVLRKQVLEQEAGRLGIAVPDSAIRQMLDQIPAFQTNGVFDKAKFAQVLQQNNSSPDQFIADVRHDLSDRQLLGPIMAGVTAPDALLKPIFSAMAEQRFASTVQIPVATQPLPASPDDATLQRFWRNHPDQFTAPEYRKVKLVILSPALLAPSEQVPQADVDAAMAHAAGTAPSVPERSVQVLSVGDLASSSRIEAAWKKGKSWSEIQAMAKSFGASAIELSSATQTQIPNANLAAAVFAAEPGKVVGPIAGDTGMYVFKVTQTGQSGPDQAALRAQVMQQLQLQKAQADVAQDVDGLQDALAGQTPLDQLPANLGLTAAEGTLDANGNTPDGTPAPVPGGDALKAAVIKAAFAAHQGDPAQLTNGPDGSYFALTVDQVIPPALAPFAQVRGKVLSAWLADQQTREAEQKAADLLYAVQQGQKLDALAAAKHYSVTTTPAITRNGPPPAGIDTQFVNVMFSLKPGQATMEQTATGFTVAVLSQVVDPTPEQDPADYAQLTQAMTKLLQEDIGESFLDGLQRRDKVSVNQKLLSQLYQ